MVMLEELYNVISDSYKAMNREFDIPLSSITEETQLKDLDMDSVSFVVIMMNIEDKMNVRLNVDSSSAFQTVGDVLSAIKAAKNQ
jgi:acyl carrier protein